MRNNKIDTMKGILIILVIGIHVTANLLNQRDLTQDHLPANGLLSDYIWIILRNVIGFAVPGFLFISGYVLTHIYSDKEPFESIPFYKKRLTRIYIPFAIWLTVYLLFWGNPSFYNIFIALAFLDGWFHFWYLWIIFICYLLFPFFLRSIKHNLAVFSVCLLAAIVCTSLLPELTLSGSHTISFIIKNKILALPINIIYFCIGIAVCAYIKKDIFEIETNNLFISLIIIIYAFCIYGKMHSNYSSVTLSHFMFTFTAIIFNSISIFFLILIVNLITSKADTKTFALSAFGLSSYGIYLSHMVFLYISRNLLERFFSNQSTLHAVLTFLICILISFVLFRVLANKKVGVILGF